MTMMFLPMSLALLTLFSFWYTYKGKCNFNKVRTSTMPAREKMGKIKLAIIN